MEVKFTVILLIAAQFAFGQSVFKLEGTDLVIRLPEAYRVKKEVGVDYITYRFIKKNDPDSSDAFLMIGCCVGTIGPTLSNAKLIDSSKKSLLEQQVNWMIYQWGSDNLAETIVPINQIKSMVLGIKSKRREEIGEMIKSFETLTRRN